ncbi:methyl-accepting chemotaxis protein [Paenibacillus ihuae]|uniref:methyl-accepting chemotaxis protein n=1 Tax=Paenibacillus ihuae TaxID=1232431 RepID=UPI0006D55B1E|nr:methyl-accepting chemotaxis protein [Paenibacillus ihuae]
MNKIKMSVKAKLLSVLLIPILAMALTCYLSLNLVNTTNNNLQRVLYDHGYNLTYYITNADRDMYQAYSAVQLFLATGDKQALDDYYANLEQVNERVGNTEGVLLKYKDARILNLKAENGNNISTELADAKLQFAEWGGIISELLNDPGEKTVTNELLRVDQFNEARDKLDAAEGIVEDFMKTEVNNSEKAIAASFIKVASISVVLLLLSFFLGFLYISKISSAFKMIQKVMERLTDGDLTVDPLDLRSKDEIGQVGLAINNMTGKIKELIEKSVSLSQTVATASIEISQNTEEVVRSSTHQASDAQTMTTLVAELSMAVTSVAQNAERASSMYQQTVGISTENMRVVDASINEMNAASQQMIKLQEDSKKIGNILDLIDDIAEQTNLLALNAAIEAARAGEHGRGFAVVADEVRKLAERSGEATRQISQIIETMQENTAKSVAAVGLGVQSSLDAAAAFDKIKGIVNETAQLITEIAAASEEQAAQADDVLQSVQSIAAASQEVCACAEETSASSHALVDSTALLNESLEAFRMS